MLPAYAGRLMQAELDALTKGLEAPARPVVAIVGRTDAGDTMHVELQGEGEPLDVLTRHGEMPLPPYITSTSSEPERYQTVYARARGSIAAPTAGLHFDDQLIASLRMRARLRCVQIASVYARRPLV